MGKIITLDSDVLVILAGGATTIPRGRERADQMLSLHMGKGDDIYIPAPAFAECCHSIEDEVLAQLRIASFGAAAARITNRISKAVREAGGTDRNQGSSPTRQELKVDAMILATAEALQADILYIGTDRWFINARETAQLRVEVKELPPFEPEAQRLPTMEED